MLYSRYGAVGIAAYAALLAAGCANAEAGFVENHYRVGATFCGQRASDLLNTYAAQTGVANHGAAIVRGSELLWSSGNSVYTVNGLAKPIAAMVALQCGMPLGSNEMTAEDFAEHCQTHLFEPLAMGSTEIVFTGRDDTLPTASVRTNIKDISRLVRMLLMDGTLDGQTVLSAADVRALKGVPNLFAQNGESTGTFATLRFDAHTGIGAVVLQDRQPSGKSEAQAFEILLRRLLKTA